MTTFFFFFEIKFHRKEIKPYPPDIETLLNIVTKTQDTLFGETSVHPYMS